VASTSAAATAAAAATPQSARPAKSRADAKGSRAVGALLQLPHPAPGHTHRTLTHQPHAVGAGGPFPPSVRNHVISVGKFVSAAAVKLADGALPLPPRWRRKASVAPPLCWRHT
jgi:hypothetical protein